MRLKIGVAFKQKMWGEESVDSHFILKKIIFQNSIRPKYIPASDYKSNYVVEPL